MRTSWAWITPLVTTLSGIPSLFQVPERPGKFISGFKHNGVLVSTWWIPDSGYVVQMQTASKKTQFSRAVPTVLTAPATVNMKSIITSVTIAGEVISYDIWNDSLSSKALPGVELCITAGTTLGPLLAIAEGIGDIRLINQDSGFMTCTLLGSSTPVLAMGIAKGREEYHLVGVGRDMIASVYDIPWGIAHSRSQHKVLPRVAPSSRIQLPLIDIGSVKVHGCLAVVHDFSGSSMCVISLINRQIVLVSRGLRRGYMSSFLVGDSLCMLYRDGTVDSISSRSLKEIVKTVR